jgi:hypothetical protein
MFFQIIFDSIRLGRKFVFVNGNNFSPDFRSVAQILLAGSIIIFVSVPPDFEAKFHFGSWTILISWIVVLLRIGDGPTKFGLFVNILRLVFRDILTFFLAVFPILVINLIRQNQLVNGKLIQR